MEIDLNLSMFKCFICDKTYVHKRSLTFHLKQVHQACEAISEERLRVGCQEDNCYERFCSTFELVEHLSSAHNKEMIHEIHDFDNNSEFIVWKSEVERETSARFVLKRSWNKKDGSTGRVYNCNRSGTYKPTVDENKRKRKIKAQGSRKIGQLCPARIFMTEHTDGTIRVEAMLTHYGHQCQLNHISFSKEERSFIQSKLAMGISPERIIGDIRANVNGSRLERIDLANNKDLCNMLYSLKREIESTKRDSKTRVVEMCSDEDENPLLPPSDYPEQTLTTPNQVVHVEVLGESLEAEDVTQKEVSDLCMSLHGQLLTHTLDTNKLSEIRHRLKSLIATVQLHGHRSIAVDNISVISLQRMRRGRPRKRTSETCEEEAATNSLPTIVYDATSAYNYSIPPNSEAVVHDDPHYEASEQIIQFNPMLDFIKKVCNHRGYTAATIGYKIKLEDLALRQNMPLIESDILNLDQSQLAHYFEDEAVEKLLNCLRQEGVIWSCAICQQLAHSEMVICNKCLRCFHYACVGFDELPQAWTCSSCL